MFYIIGLGLSDEKDITLRGLEVIQLRPILLRSISYCPTTNIGYKVF
jgi:precorrin-2 methylase